MPLIAGFGILIHSSFGWEISLRVIWRNEDNEEWITKSLF